jgi:hypothetical protein
MALRITILEYANIKGLTIYDIVQNAKEKGVILPEDPKYVLDDSQIKQIDPIFAHQNKYKQINSKNNIDSKEAEPEIFILRDEHQIGKGTTINFLGKIDLNSLN